MIPRFYLEDPRGTGLCYIRVRVRTGSGNQIKEYLPSEIRIKKDDWSHKDQRVKPSHRNARTFNLFLQDITNRIEDKWWELKSADRLTDDEMRRALKHILKGESEEPIFDVFRMIAEERKNNPMYSKTIYNKYMNIAKKIEEFRPTLSWKDVNLDFISKWINYLFTEHEVSTNTAARYYGFLRALMNEAKKRGYHQESGYLGFKLKGTKTIYPYLNLDELNQIYEKAMPSEHLESAKRLLLMGCYSGQRQSDWHKLKPSNMVNIKGKDYYRISNQKTKKIVHILAIDKLKNLVNMPSTDMSQQKFNVHVKTVCKIAEINQPFTRPVFQGNVMKEITLPKHEFVTSHIGRRSFVCNSIMLGVPHEFIKQVGGWRDDKSFRQYIQLSSTDGLEAFEVLN
jgi:hypothetical protein